MVAHALAVSLLSTARLAQIKMNLELSRAGTVLIDLF